MCILDVRRLWRGSEGDDDSCDPEEVLAYVKLALKCAQPACAARRPPPPQGVCGDLARDGGDLLGPGIVPMEGDGPARVSSRGKIAHEDTLFIFDWDDTILCTSWLCGHRLKLDSSSEPTVGQREQLDELARVATETIRRAKELGTVVVVTNAERGWIELTCGKYMPAMAPVLEGVSLISARSTYESPEVKHPLDWKLAAFDREIRAFCRHDASVGTRPQRFKNILSLGDSVHEREALMRCAGGLPYCYSKSLKFLVKPDIAEISQQHSLVQQSLDRVVHHGGNLDLRLQCS